MKSSSEDESPLAAYRQIEQNLRNRIRQGHWSVGTMLPGRRALAREYGVSPLTVERAVTHLLADGTLRADKGRGTFVERISPALGAVEAAETPSPAIADHSATARPSAGATRAAVRPATIGLIASLYVFNYDHLELNNYLVRTLLESMEHAFSERGTETRFCNRVVGAGQPLLSLEQAISSLAESGVDAIAMSVFEMDPSVVDESLTMLDAHDIPIVCITSSALRRPVPHICYDNYSAGYQAAQHLLRAGHREILVLAPFTSWWVRERIVGVRSAVEHANLPTEAVRIYPATSGPWIHEEDPEIPGYEAGRAAFAEGLIPSATICVNDGVAFGFVKAAEKEGKTIGKDIALVSFDNHPRSRSLGITSLRAPMEGMGREAARLLIRHMRGEETGFQIRLRWHLIPRASSRIGAKHARAHS